MEFKLKEETEFIELVKLLKIQNISASGGDGKRLIREGLVKVNGEVELRKKAKLREGDVIEIEGQEETIIII